MKRILSIALSLCCIITTIAAMPEIVSAAEPVTYFQNFEKANAISDIAELSIEGGSASIVNDNGNKALRVTGGEKVTISAPSSTTNSTVEVSYKLKYISYGSPNFNADPTEMSSFAAMQGTDEITAAFRSGAQLFQYTKGAGTINNQRLFYLGNAPEGSSNISGDGKYHEIKYSINFTNKSARVYIDGVEQTSYTSAFRTDSATGIDKMYFDIPTDDEIYFDDILITENPLYNEDTTMGLGKFNELYEQDFETASAISDISELVIKGGNASIFTDNGNKVLKVTGGEKVKIYAPGSTTKSTVEVSYKLKFVKAGTSANWQSFAAMQGSNEVAATFRLNSVFFNYTNVVGKNNNQRLFYLNNAPAGETNVAGDGRYHEIKNKIDFKNNLIYVTIDGELKSWKPILRTADATGVNSLYFDVPTGDEIYFDDIVIKEETLKLNSSIPEANSKNYKMGASLTLNMSAEISSGHLSSEHFKLYENDVLVPSYTVTQPKTGQILITPANGFKGNSTYKVVIKNTVNSDVEGAITTSNDIAYEFTTQGFLVTAVNDSYYGGKVFTNGKTYKFTASYKNDTGKTQYPVILVTKTKNGLLLDAEIKDGYTVAAGAIGDFTFNYTAADLDQNTKVNVYLWNSTSEIVPLAEITTATGEYADGTPVYEAKLLAEVKERCDAISNADFRIGAIADVQPNAANYTTSYKSYLHHFGSITKAADYVGLDCIADLGDALDTAFNKSEGIGLLEAQSDILKTAGVPVFRVKGNHDGNESAVANKQDTSLWITDNEWVDSCDVNWATTMQGTTVGTKPYYYKDFDDAKIRVIALNTQDTNEGDNDETMLDGHYSFGFTQAQLEWFAGEALDFSGKADKSEWGVVLLGHMIGGWNGDALLTILNAYQNGTSGTIASGTVAQSPITNLEYDFTGQGAMEYILALDGDTHVDGYKLYAGKPKITLGTSNPDHGTKYYSDRDLKSDNEDLWDVVTIDRTNRKIYCTRFGAGSDREFSY